MSISLTPQIIVLTAKDPSDVVDIELDFSNLILNDTITGTPTINITPNGITVVASSITSGQGGNNKSVTMRLSGGIATMTYQVKVTIQTVNGDTFARSVLFPVQER